MNEPRPEIFRVGALADVQQHVQRIVVRSIVPLAHVLREQEHPIVQHMQFCVAGRMH